MKAVYKYTLEGNISTFQMPVGAEILCLQLQYLHPTIWALVDTSAPMEERKFMVVGTGHGMGNNIKGYVGTFQEQHGDFVFHVFEVMG